MGNASTGQHCGNQRLSGVRHHTTIYGIEPGAALSWIDEMPRPSWAISNNQAIMAGQIVWKLWNSSSRKIGRTANRNSTLRSELGRDKAAIRQSSRSNCDMRPGLDQVDACIIKVEID